jgi:hypothetical protein
MDKVANSCRRKNDNKVIILKSKIKQLLHNARIEASQENLKAKQMLSPVSASVATTAVAADAAAAAAAVIALLHASGNAEPSA